MQGMMMDTSIVVVVDDGKKLGAKIKSFPHDKMKILVTEVTAGGLADRYGLRLNDRLTAVGGKPVDMFTNYKEVLSLLREQRPLQLVFSKEMDEEYEVVQKKSRVQLIIERHEQALQSKDMATIQRLCFQGIEERYRPIFWRILLNYLPPDMDKWKETLDRQRSLYEEFKKEFLKSGLEDGVESSRPKRLHGQGWWEQDVNAWGDRPQAKKNVQQQESVITDSTTSPEEIQLIEQEEITKTRTAATDDENDKEEAEDHHPLEPLTVEELRRKELHEQDAELRETIWKDVQRTHPGFHFFADTRCEIMERVLFLFAKLNGGLKYVQGMNELVAPILFVFGNNAVEQKNPLEEGGGETTLDFEQFEFDKYYEVDTFFCFCNLMGELKDLYMEGMDSDHIGIKGKGEELMKLLKEKDPPVHEHLVELQINPQFFALRWITTLLSRELMLPDTVRLWDSLFADPHRFQFLIEVCCAMIILQRQHLLESDFSGCLQTLQKYPPTDLPEILQVAEQIRKNEAIPIITATNNASVNNVVTNTLIPNLNNLANATSQFMRKNFLIPPQSNTNNK